MLAEQIPKEMKELFIVSFRHSIIVPVLRAQRLLRMINVDSAISALSLQVFQQPARCCLFFFVANRLELRVAGMQFLEPSAVA